MRVTDAYHLAAFRRHCAASSCSCDVNGPSRDCDIGWALWKVAHQFPEADA
jgi:hypothetical protein